MSTGQILTAPTAQPHSPPLESPAARSKGQWPIVLVAISFAPLVVVHFVQALAKPHYQYVLLLPVALFLAARQRLRGARTTEPGAKPLVALGLIGSWLLLAAATLLWSPWLGVIAAMAMSLTWLYSAGGRKLTKLLFPVWLLAWFALPLPFGLDEKVTSRLRTVTTNLSSLTLDELGVLHLRAVNVIELPKKPLFIADACSGINSLFVVLAFAAFCAVWSRRTLIHGILLLCAGFGLVLVENVARLVCIAAGEQYGWNLAEGRPHEALGALLFAVAVLLVVSADQLVMFLIPNHRWFRSSSTGSARDHSAGDSWRTQAGRAEFPLARLSVVAFLALAGLQLLTLPAAYSGLKTLFAKPVDFPEFAAETLPAELAGFQRTDFKHQKRAPGDPQGEHSQAWTFERDGLSIVVSLDYPYPGLHDLTVCYQNIGWIVQESHFAGTNGPTESPAADPDAYAEAEMRRSFYGHGLLLFSLCDRERPGWVRLKTAEVKSFPQRLTERLQLQFNRKAPDNEAGVPTQVGSLFQVQIMARSAVPFTNEQRSECRELFQDVRKLLYARCLEELGPSS